MRYTQFAALVDPDPDKEMSTDSLSVLAANADAILVGGTPNIRLNEEEGVYTQRCIDKIRAVRKGVKPPIYIFPGTPNQVVPGADKILYLFIPNSTDPFFNFGIQIMSIEDVLKKYDMGDLEATMYLPMGGKVAEYAKVESGWLKDEFRNAMWVAIMLGFKHVYLEGGSGGIRIDPEIICSVSEILPLEKNLWVGGGYKKEEDVREIVGLADFLVVGTALEEDPSFAKDVRSILDEQIVQRRV